MFQLANHLGFNDMKMHTQQIRVGNRDIGENNACYLVAEMSGNHGGGIDKALEIIKKAKQSGADAVKIQVYRPDTITLDSDSEDFAIPAGSPWESYGNMYKLYQYAHTPWEWVPQLFEEASKQDIDIFGSVFDLTSVDFLEEQGCCAYKIASPEVVDVPLLRRVAQTGKPVIVSTGLSDLSDLELAIKTLNDNGCHQIVLLKCTTAYPAPVSEANLRTIPNLKETFGYPAGLSDHTEGIGVPVASVALGASMIEKHFMLGDQDSTVDSFFSLTPVQFEEMAKAVRQAQAALGNVVYGVTDEAKKNINARRSLYVSAPVKKGGVFTESNIKSVRPGFGLAPKYFDKVLGSKARMDLKCGDRLTWDCVEP